MTTPTIGVLAVQGDVSEHVRALEQVGAQAVTVRRPAELQQVHGLVIPGGESTTMIRLLRTFELLEPLRERIAGGLPVYGSCAGMIMLADQLVGTPGQATVGGLDISVRRNAFGRQVDSFETNLDVTGFDTPMHAVFIRAPWVESVGHDVTVLAQVNEHPVVVQQGRLLASSFHPELTGDLRLHEHFTGIVRRQP